MLVHVDTDFGGDPDDAAAVAMLLGWPGGEVVGLTTNLEVDGQRAGCAQHYLDLAGRGDVPVAAGAAATLTGGRYLPTWGDERHWPTAVRPVVTVAGAALDLLERNVGDGATVLAIGALTNLALLEVLRPGALAGVRVVVMGGWLALPPTGWPQWGPDVDFNIQADLRAAEIVVASEADLTFVPLAIAMQAQLRAADLDALRATGPVGELLARQSLVHAHDAGMAELAAAHDELPDDLVNFHWDPVAAAVAVRSPTVTLAPHRVRAATDPATGALHLVDHPTGRPAHIATALDPSAFRTTWLQAIERLPGRSAASADRPGR